MAQVLFDSQLEYEETVDNFVTKPSVSAKKEPARPPPRPAPPRPETPPRQMPEKREEEERPVETPFVDLLNLNGGANSDPVPKLSDLKVNDDDVKVGGGNQSFDLLGSFDGGSVDLPTGSGGASGIVPDLLGGGIGGVSGGATAAASGSGLDILDDIFSSPKPMGAAGVSAAPPLRPSAGPSAVPSQQPKVSPPAAAPSDPFSTFGNITTDWLGFSAGTGKTASAPSTQRTSPSSGNPPAQPSMQKTANTPPMTTTSPRFPSTPVMGMGGGGGAGQRANDQGAGQQRPDYSRANFGAGSSNAGGAGAAKPGGVGGDIFGDILGSQGYSFASRPSNSTRSINEMRKEELVKEMDPEKIKIMEWVS